MNQEETQSAKEQAGTALQECTSIHCEQGRRCGAIQKSTCSGA